jgi:hypothetical protein
VCDSLCGPVVLHATSPPRSRGSPSDGMNRPNRGHLAREFCHAPERHGGAPGRSRFAHTRLALEHRPQGVDAAGAVEVVVAGLAQVVARRMDDRSGIASITVTAVLQHPHPPAPGPRRPVVETGSKERPRR